MLAEIPEIDYRCVKVRETSRNRPGAFCVEPQPTRLRLGILARPVIAPFCGTDTSRFAFFCCRNNLRDGIRAFSDPRNRDATRFLFRRVRRMPQSRLNLARLINSLIIRLRHLTILRSDAGDVCAKYFLPELFMNENWIIRPLRRSCRSEISVTLCKIMRKVPTTEGDSPRRLSTARAPSCCFLLRYHDDLLLCRQKMNVICIGRAKRADPSIRVH